MARTVPPPYLTAVDELRYLLDAAEKRAINIRGAGAERAGELLAWLDRIDALLPELEASGADVRAEQGRWPGVQGVVRKHASAILPRAKTRGRVGATTGGSRPAACRRTLVVVSRPCRRPHQATSTYDWRRHCQHRRDPLLGRTLGVEHTGAQRSPGRTGKYSHNHSLQLPGRQGLPQRHCQPRAGLHRPSRRPQPAPPPVCRLRTEQPARPGPGRPGKSWRSSAPGRTRHQSGPDSGLRRASLNAACNSPNRQPPPIRPTPTPISPLAMPWKPWAASRRRWQAMSGPRSSPNNKTSSYSKAWPVSASPTWRNVWPYSRPCRRRRRPLPPDPPPLSSPACHAKP